MRPHCRYLTVVPFAVLFAITTTLAQTKPEQRAQDVIDKGVAYLKSQQKPDGGWQNENEPPAITALVLKAVIGTDGHDANAEYVKKGYEKLLSYQVDDGGIYKDGLANYNTAIALSALTAAKNPAWKDREARAIAYLKRLQWTDKTVTDDGTKLNGADDPWYGGWGYGRSKRPDLSNAQMTLDALRDAGLKSDDPAFQAAMKFATRVQNSSETNPAPWAGNDGGFVYSPGPTRNGESMAGEYTTADGKRLLRSYGSMTYAGLKTFIYAGLSKDDQRVKAAWDWITKNWTLDENPGMKLNKPENAQHGLYYYFHTMARALNEYDEPVITDPQGNKHDWRVELLDKVASLQKPDGSWAGEARWMEGNPVLVTSYVVLALEEVKKDLAEHPAK